MPAPTVAEMQEELLRTARRLTEVNNVFTASVAKCNASENGVQGIQLTEAQKAILYDEVRPVYLKLTALNALLDQISPSTEPRVVSGPNPEIEGSPIEEPPPV